MLRKINRIRKKKDFATVFGNSKTFRSALLVFKAAKNNLGVDRFGFIVSKKVSKRAVDRNKVKRRLTEAIRSEAEAMKAGTDLILVALPGIEKKEFFEIKEAVGAALAKMGLTASGKQIK